MPITIPADTSNDDRHTHTNNSTGGSWDVAPITSNAHVTEPPLMPEPVHLVMVDDWARLRFRSDYKFYSMARDIMLRDGLVRFRGYHWFISSTKMFFNHNIECWEVVLYKTDHLSELPMVPKDKNQARQEELEKRRKGKEPEKEPEPVVHDPPEHGFGINDHVGEIHEYPRRGFRYGVSFGKLVTCSSGVSGDDLLDLPPESLGWFPMDEEAIRTWQYYHKTKDCIEEGREELWRAIDRTGGLTSW